MPFAVSRTSPAGGTDRDPDGTADHGAGRARHSGDRQAALAYLAVGAVLWVVVWLAFTTLPRHADVVDLPAAVDYAGESVVGGWFQWDANWYRDIAEGGYRYDGPGQQANVAFFPAYPLAMRGVGLVVGDVVLAGVAITVVCGLGVAVLFRRWCGDRFDDRSSRAALLTLLLYPYAWYLFGAVYGDALFLLAALAAFVLLERDHPVAAGLAGAVACAARPVGLAVAVGLVAVAAERRGVLRIPLVERARDVGWRAAWHGGGDRLPAPDGRSPRRFAGVELALGRWRRGDWALLLAPLGLVAWSGYLWWRFGDPTLYSKIQDAPGWDQGEGIDSLTKAHWRDLLSQYWSFTTAGPLGRWQLDGAWSNWVYTTGVTFQAGLVVGALALVPRVARRVGWGYALYVLAVIAPAVLGSKDWQGSGRYLLAAFPAFAVVGELLADRPRRRWAAWTVSGLLLVLLTHGFARGYYLA